MASTASSTLRVAASGDPWSARSPSAEVSRAWASRWWPRRCSMAAHEAMSRTRTAAISAGTRSRASRRADRLSASSPAEARVVALATRRPRRASYWSWGRSRSAAWYHRAAVAGARGAAAAGRFPEQGDGLGVAGSGRPLDVVGPDLGRRALPLEDVGDAAVGGEPPPGAGRLVDAVAHDRVAEAEAPGHRGWAHQVEPDQLVEEVERLGFLHPGGGGRQLGLERLARHRRPCQQRSGPAPTAPPARPPGRPAPPVARPGRPGRGHRSAPPWRPARTSCCR